MGYRASLSCSSPAQHPSAGERRQGGSQLKPQKQQPLLVLSLLSSGPWTGTQHPRNGLPASSEPSELHPPGALHISLPANTACHSFLCVWKFCTSFAGQRERSNR